MFSLAAFVIRELTARFPAVNLRLFKDPVFTSGTLIGALMFAMLMASMFLLPIFMQELLGFTATQSGMALMPRTLVMMVAVPDRRPHLQHGVAASGDCTRRAAVRGQARGRLSHFTLDSGTATSSVPLLDPGRGLRLPVRAADHRGAVRVPRHKMADATGPQLV